jgi:type IV pilus assembly protein PilE
MIRKPAQGFTLVELMITVSIMTILALIAYPGYQNHLVRLRASDAQAQLLDIMQRQRKFFTEANQYTTDLTLITDLEPSGDGAVITEQGYHSISAIQCGEAEPLSVCVQLVATPLVQEQEIIFAYNSRNEKFPSGEW